MAMFGSLFGGGAGAARNQTKLNLENGRIAQNYALTSGYNTARGDLNTGSSNAINALSPYMRQGQAGYDRYASALGVNGRQAQQGVYDDYQSDPFQQASRTAGQNVLNQIRAKYNAAGQGTQSGNLYNDLNRQSQDLESARQQQYLAHLQGLGQTGYGAASNIAGIHQNTGAGLAGLASQYGRDTAGVEGGYYAGLNQADAQYNQQKMQGANNLLNLIGSAAGMTIGGFAPGMSGMSAFGNMARGFGRQGIR